ncbi:MAG: type VI secretion system ATPase TssH, partial [Deltaproteobacteria bacterium]|nr:type VI secretion system ATPase TssH [Deltaproteobacteria bacterium]
MNLNQFTVKAQEAVVDAQSLAIKKSHQSVDLDHLLYSLLKQEDSLVTQCLEKISSGLPKRALSDLDSILNKKAQVHGNVQTYTSSSLQKLFVQSEEESTTLKDDFISTEHLFLSMFSSKDPSLTSLLKSWNLSRNGFLEALSAVRGTQRVTDQNPEEKYNALERYTRNLTKAAANGRLDPVIGRDSEIRRVIQVLSRRTKNNPVLIGDPGVGKTAIVEGLAQRIIAKDVPDSLKDKSLLSLDLGSLVAGAK